MQLKHVLLRLRSDSTRRQPPLCYIDLPTFEHGAHNATGLRRDSTWSVYNPLELGVVEDPMVSFHHKTFRFEVLISTKIYHGHGPFIMSTHQLRSKKGRFMFFHEIFFKTQTKRSSELGFTSFVQC